MGLNVMTKRVMNRGQRYQRMVIATAGLAALGHGALAYGTAYTWLGTSGNNWNSTVNWSSNGVQTAPPTTPASGDTTDLVWTGNMAANVTSTQNTGPITVDSMSFDFVPTGTATLSISGSSTGTQQINLGAGGIHSTTSGTVAFASGANRTLVLTADQTWYHQPGTGTAIFAMRRPVSGNFKITKQGSG